MAKRDTSESESEEDASSSSSSEEEAAEETAAAKGVSEYEKQRLSRIAANKARLEALGLPKMASSLKGLATSNKNKKGKEKVKDDDDDDEEYRPDDGEEPASDSSSQDGDEHDDKDEDFVAGNASRSRKRKVGTETISPELKTLFVVKLSLGKAQFPNILFFNSFFMLMKLVCIYIVQDYYHYQQNASKIHNVTSIILMLTG